MIGNYVLFTSHIHAPRFPCLVTDSDIDKVSKAMENEGGVSFLSQKKENLAYFFNDGIEMKSFRLCLKWVCLDQSNIWKTGLSWSFFFLLAIGIPIVSHFFLLCSDCDSKHQRPYDAVVQLSLSIFAIVSFLSLSSWSHKYGLSKFLFLDKLDDEAERIRRGYKEQLQKSMKLLCIFVLPCLTAEAAYRIWWYTTGATQIPYFENKYVSDTIACILQLCSWAYRISIYILVCIIYRLICYLQILRLEDFAQVFQMESDVGSILKEHLRIRRNLRVISHRFRRFILLSLVLVTASQLISLLVTTRSTANNNIFEAGELLLCSINLVTGLFICLRSATKITHKAQSITSLAAKWHVCATINSYDDMEGETPTNQSASIRQVFPIDIDWVLDDDDDDGDDDPDSSTKLVPIFAHTISFQKRQALVTYLENNRAGMTVYGSMMDRTWLHTIFGIELALLLWLLNKTIGRSFVGLLCSCINTCLYQLLTFRFVFFCFSPLSELDMKAPGLHLRYKWSNVGRERAYKGKDALANMRNFFYLFIWFLNFVTTPTAIVYGF
ncbi:uncharacterized protein LOC8277958 isoform X2 [Ricinus communis]|uniref:uncharacterized protein LOC8277958 isoform X2 n=1 Tax=Ricinus communis TaxID=3988 RepID=UPI00201AE88D|nr:uncharacterized protein LOC8277958 isoform X2 [Ricinus communis]